MPCFFTASALLAWGAAVVMLEPTVLLLANEWQLGRASGAVLGSTLVVLIVAGLLFGGTLPLLRVGTWSMQWLFKCLLLGSGNAFCLKPVCVQ